jgi:hypothetical protein
VVARSTSVERAQSVETRTSSPRAATLRSTWTLRRVALAASVALVAGVSYEVGKRGDATSAVAPQEHAVKLPTAASSMSAVPSVVDASSDSFAATPTPAPRVMPRGGPRADAPEVAAAEPPPVAEPSALRAPIGAAAGAVAPIPAAPAAAASMDAPKPTLAQSASAAKVAANTAELERAPAPRREQYVEQSSPDRAVDPGGSRRARNADSDGAGAQSAQAPMQQQRSQNVQRDVQSSAEVADAEPRGAVSAAKKAVPLSGYTAIQESSAGAVTRLRYMSSAGTPLTLMIVQSVSEAKQRASARSDAAPMPAPVSEFLVSTANGISAVRWTSRGMNYELSGALAPDSLIKLATQLK